ncbi:MAG: class II aldolase/adducin family protein [Bacillati bacterium ANGP1]|uniref:Class II aldolase/adducin family protein n=1 Tax=Candidatus Segetimicrobium genomatis TaxID=2569760 RepID=A0A537JLZ4_9BACT|nr:MAG: class II aldolase/adducin family protein [Terrabacteria group bacterium ANGP1]
MARRARSQERSKAIERRLREQVAACTRLLNDLGILGYSGHVGARLPGRDAFLVQSFDQSRAAIRPDDLLICDFDGSALGGPAGVRPPSEVYLHAEILRVRHDVHAVAHFHHDPSIVFTLVDRIPLRPVKNHAARWASGIPVHPDPSHVSDPARGRAAARSLGPHHAMLIRAHGQVVTAETVPALLVDCVHFVENAEAMYRAASLGAVRPLTADEIARFLRGFDRDRHVAKPPGRCPVKRHGEDASRILRKQRG